MITCTKSETFFCVSATNVARAGKWGNICVGNNVSTTMCPRLPGPLGDYGIRVLGCQGIRVPRKIIEHQTEPPCWSTSLVLQHGGQRIV